MAYVLWAIGVWVASSLTLSTGIGAGVVYAPVLALGFGLDLETAIATSLVVQVAGVGTTALGHRTAQRIDRGLALRLGLLAAVGFGVSRSAVGSVSFLGAEVAYTGVMGVVGLWLLLGRRLPLHSRAADSRPVLSNALRCADDGTEYDFCHPNHGYILAAVAGAGTGLVGISGAEVQITALMLRCGVPPRIAVGTGSAAASLTLLVASAAVLGTVDWPFAVVGIPAAVIGAHLARLLAHRLNPAAMRIGVGLLALGSALGVGFRALNGF